MTGPRTTAASHSAFFDIEAARYDAAYDAPTVAGFSVRTRLAAVIAALNGRSGKVLDVGMGPGRLCAELARRSWTVSGVDPSSAMVARARACLPAAAERLLEGRIEHIPAPDASFDAVVAAGVLEYAADLQAAVCELARVLRPGGIAVVTLPNPRALYAKWRGGVLYPGVRLVKRVVPIGRPAPVLRLLPTDPGTFAAVLERADLWMESLRYTNYIVLPTPLESLLPRLTISIAIRLEHQAPRFGPLLATQMVVAARKGRETSG